MQHEKLPKLTYPTAKHRSSFAQKGKQPIGSYIEQSLKWIDRNCSDGGKLSIDGGYGDYRMSIFRLKDRNKRIKNISTIFTDTFMNRVEEISPISKNILQKIAKKPNLPYLQPETLSTSQEPTTIPKPKWQAQEQQYLYYDYVPKYEKQRWFATKIQSKPQPVKRPSNPQSEPRPVPLPPQKKKKSRKTHIFRFMDRKFMQMIDQSIKKY